MPELEALEQRGYFSRPEIKAIVQKRQVRPRAAAALGRVVRPKRMHDHAAWVVRHGTRLLPQPASGRRQPCPHVL